MGTRKLPESNKSIISLFIFVIMMNVLLYSLPERSKADQSDLSVSVADAGIQSFADSGLPNNDTVRVENFNSRDLQSNSSFSFSGPAGAWSGTGWIQAASVYGGAGGSGRHATANNNTLVLDMPVSGVDYRYIGFWWSGGNNANYIDLVEADGSIGATFSATDLAAVVGTCGPNPPTNGYCGNPNLTINGTSYSSKPVPGELFAFVHIRYSPGFRQIKFRGAGFEFDNVTVSQIMPGASDTETFTETFNPYTLSAPSVIALDPRDTFLSFPGISLGAGSGETQALVCLTEVTNSSGSTEVENPTLQIGTSLSGESFSVSGRTSFYSGTRQDVIDLSSTTTLQGETNGPIAGASSKFLKISVTPQANIGLGGCEGAFAVSEVVELRPLALFQSELNAINLGGN